MVRDPSATLVWMICSLKGFPANRDRASSLVTTRRWNFCFFLAILDTSASMGLSILCVCMFLVCFVDGV